MVRREDLDPKLIKLEHSVRGIGHMLRSFEADYGSDELVKFMNKTGLPVEYFDNEHNWVSFDYLINILDRFVEYTGDPEIAYKYGLNNVKYADEWGILKTVFTLIPSPIYIYKSAVRFQPRYSKIGNSKITVLKKNKVLIEFGFKEGYKTSINNCLNIKGVFESLPTIFGLPPAQIKELRCAAEGADACAYEITWKEKSTKKKDFFSLLIGIIIVYIFYFIIDWLKISPVFFAKPLLFLLPFGFYFIGRVLDYKRTIKDNTEVVEEQNKATIDSLENVQGINEELQQKIDQRTAELKISNKILDEALIALRKSEEELLLAERMVGIGQLAAGVAHEINNPMGAVRNYLQDVLEDVREDDPRRKDLLEAEKATDESKVLINDLLSFARTEENLYIIDINLNEAIEKILIRKGQDFLNSGIKIYKDFAPNLPTIKSDPMQINQVFTNVITNASNAIKEKGEIYIKTSSGIDGVYVEIKDNGDIIPDNIIGIVFDPPEKNHEEHEESIGRKDLGLAISYNIVKRFNGEMTVKSSIGNGTEFSIVIPYSIKS